jgi:hypothetical protein
VRLGQCGAPRDDGPFGAASHYKPLEVESDGRATATTTVPIPTPEDGQYYVVLRASQANAMTVVACGNFAPPTR